MQPTAISPDHAPRRAARTSIAMGVVLAMLVTMLQFFAFPVAATAATPATPQVNAPMRMQVGSDNPLLLTQINIGNDLGQTPGFKRNWNSGWSIAQLWASVPDDLKHNIGFVLHQGHTALSDRNPDLSAKWLEDNIAEADALGIPIFILWAEGRTLPSNSTRFQFLESMYQKYPHFMGTVVSERADTLGDLPEALRIANLYGGFHILGSLEETNSLATRMETQSYWNSVAQYKQNFIFNPKNFHENFETSNAWAQGAWLAGAFDNWGPYFDGYPYYGCGIFGARTQYSNCGDRWSRSMAETLASMMMLDQWQNGATVFHLENQLDVPTTGSLYSPYFYQSILPAMRYILSHKTPTREDVIAKTKVVYSEATSPIYSLADSISAGRTGNPDMTRFYSMYENSPQLTAVQKSLWFYLRSNGRYNIIPRIPKLAPASLLARFDTVLTKATYDPTLQFGDARNALFDSKYPQISSGDAFVQKSGSSWLMYNTNDRDNFNQDAVLDLDGSTFTRLEMPEVTPHTWAAVTEDGASIDVLLDTYRTDREADLLKASGTRDMEFNRNFVKYAYVPNPQDSILRTTTMRFDVATKPVLTISGYDRNGYTYAEKWDPNTHQYTLTVQSNGVVQISLDTTGAQTGWTTVASTSPQITTAPGSLELAFDGTSIAWNAPAGATGTAAVSIDGTSFGTVDVSGGTPFRATGLTNSLHTLRIDAGSIPVESFAYVPSVEHEATNLETNDFNYGSKADDEDVVYGSDGWRVIDGKLKLVGFVFPFYGDTTVYNTNAKLANVRYDAKITLVKGTSGALVIRGNEDTKQAYHFRLDPSRTAEGRTGSATYSCSLMLDYGTSALATCPTALTLNPDTAYNVSVIANGNTITASIDGTQVLSYTASGSNVRGAGYTGVRAPQMQSDSGYRLGQFIELDDVKVTDLDNSQVVYQSGFDSWDDAQGWMTETPLVFDWNEKTDPRSSFTFPWEWATDGGTWQVQDTTAFTSGFSGYYRAVSTGAVDFTARGGAESAWARDGGYDYWSWINISSGNSAGIAVRASDSTTMYQARLDIQAQQVVFGKMIGGTWTPLKTAAAPVGLTRDTWHLIKVAAHGPLFTVTVDGHHVLDVTDRELSTGAAGVWVAAGGTALVDDGRVVARPARPATAVRPPATLVAADGISGAHITGYDLVAIKTARTKQPQLPATVSARYSDGSSGQVPVTWPTITAAQLATATSPLADGASRGKFGIEGTVAGTSLRVPALVTVMPNMTTALNITSTYDPSAPTVPTQRYDAATFSDGTNTFTKVLYIRWDDTPKTAAGSPRTQTITGTINAYPWEKATATVTVLTAPDAPTGITATAGDTRATVSWIAPAVDGGAAITGYTVTAAPGGATCATTSATSCSVGGLTNGVAYTFTVVARNSSGASNPSPASTSVTPEAGSDAPHAPTAVTAAAADQRAQIRWTAPVSNGAPITGYTVTADPGGKTCTATDTGCVVTGLTNGETYAFRVTASTASAVSPASEPSNAVTPAASGTVPGAPRTAGAAPGNAQATVSWTAPSSDGGSPVAGYLVTASPGGNTCETATTSCVVTGLANGTSYTFTVLALNALGYSSPSAATGAVIPVAGNVALAKTVTAYAQLSNANRVPAKMVDGDTTLGWYSGGASDSAFSSGATTATQGSLCTWAYVDLGADYSIGSIKIMFGENLTTYGNMFDSPYQIQVLTAAEAAAHTAAERNSSICTRLSGGNFGSIATGSTGPGTPYVVAPANDIWRTVTDGIGTTALATKTFAPATARYVRVFSNEPNTAHRFGAAVFEFEVHTSDVPTVPAAPTGVAPVAADGAATVSWTAPVNTGGATITGYTVTSQPGGIVCTSTTTSCTVAGLTNGTEYRFTVTATNSAGTSAPSRISLPVTPIGAPLVATIAPVIGGEPIVGRSLTVTAGVWNVAGVANTYQWVRNGTPISGADTSTYLVGPADVDAAIGVVVTATKPGHPTGTAAPQPVTARKAITETQLALSSASQPASGTPAVATVTVTSETSTAGTVTLHDGTTALVTGAIVDASGTAVIPIPAGLAVGVHSLTAQFIPQDASSITSSTSTAVVYEITVTRTTTTLDLSATSQYFGATSPAVATISVTADSGPQEGTVRILDAAQILIDGVELSSEGIAKVTLPADLALGTHSLTAVFVPSGSAEPSSSEPVEFTVATAASVTEISLSSASQQYGTPSPARVEVTVSSTSGAVQGTVVIVDAGEPISGEIAVAADGTATYELPGALSVGNHYLNAVFTPTDERAVATSTSTPSKLFIVAPDRSATLLSLDTASQVFGGTPATASITVTRESGEAAAGAVSLYDGELQIATVAVTREQLTVPLPADLSLGSHTITARFVPADPLTVEASTSAEQSVTVVRAASTTTATLSATTQSFGATSPATVTVTVGSELGTPGIGTVSLRDGSTAIVSMITLDANGAATMTVPASLAVGSHSLSVWFAPTAASGQELSHSIPVGFTVTPYAGKAKAAPGVGVLSSDNGQSGLRDGNYKITMNLWWGNNATVFNLYEDGVLIQTIPLTDNTPAAQTASVNITGKRNGSYTYRGELVNPFGATVTADLVVQITDAKPGVGVLSHDNWDQDGNYRVTMNMWWGTNATVYRLYEDGVLIETQSLTARTPNAQTAFSTLTGRPKGTHVYRAELENAAGVTTTQTISVPVTK